MSSRRRLILTVDDDARALRMLLRMLEAEGYRAVGASDGRAALSSMDEEMPDLVLLDVTMPDMDGYTVCRHIRESSRVPIIMVTARGDDNEKVAGLDAGADDFVTKPFSYRELTARVRAVLRRAGAWDEQPEASFVCQGLCIDFSANRVLLDGSRLTLTATEYKLLCYLARNAGRIVTPDQILEKVWGEGYRGDHHLLQVNMARLRRRLKDNARHPRYINTARGIGYTLGRESVGAA